ncbi:MAG: short-chain dehydrogenase/reductase, partial [Marmoricola sp.]|nr:short-chain dehydrogenase/reductase [Marmoricola sp.]
MSTGATGTSAVRPLEGKTALVTGAASGIGTAIAEAYAAAGAALCLADRNPGPALDDVAQRCAEAGVEVVTVRGDVSSEADVKRMYAVARDGLGSVEIVVNNAGIVTEAPVSEMSSQLWDEMIAVNLSSVFLSCREALPPMLDRGFGRIINIASQVGQRGGSGLAHYAASKAGVIGFTKSLAREVGGTG